MKKIRIVPRDDSGRELDIKFEGERLGFAIAKKREAGLYEITIVRFANASAVIQSKAPVQRMVRVREQFRDDELIEFVVRMLNDLGQTGEED